MPQTEPNVITTSTSCFSQAEIITSVPEFDVSKYSAKELKAMASNVVGEVGWAMWQGRI